MARLNRLLNVLAWGLAVVIAWTEWRDPTRPAASDEDATSDAESDGAAPTAAPASPAAEVSPTEGAGGSGRGDLPTTDPPPSPAPVPESEAPRIESEAVVIGDGAPASGDAAQTAADPLFAETTPGAPIVGTAVPIPVQPGGGRPVPPGAVAGDGTPICPPDYPIKGNASSMIYHRPGQPSYERTVAEFCFASEAEAEGSGYRPPRR